MRVRVAVDALGGDREPAEIVAGALAAAADDVRPIIYGPAGLDTHGLDHVVTHGIVEMDDKPADAVRNKQDSSLVRAVRAVGDGARRRRRLRGEHRSRSRGQPAPRETAARRLSSGDRCRDPYRSRALRPDRRRRDGGRKAGASPPVRPHGLDLRPGGARDRATQGLPPLDRRGAREGQSADARGTRVARGELTPFHRQHGGARRCSKARPT